MAAIIELYADRRSGWRVLTSQDGTTGYRFSIVDRVHRSTFAADARELADGAVPDGMEQVDLGPDVVHGMVLEAPCALWRRGRVRRTDSAPGVLTQAYVAGQILRDTSDTDASGADTSDGASPDREPAGRAASDCA
jgi:hypothetical protein